MKKGSLQLSINAIVILILAITMLGLGLGFMRNVFTSATEEFTRVGGTVQKQMIDQMKESDKIVDSDRPKIEVKRAKKDQIFIGFRNVQAAKRHFIILPPSLDPLGAATSDCEDDLATSGVKVEYKTTNTAVNPGEVVVLPVNVKVDSDADEVTCFIDFTICSRDTQYDTTPGSCVTGEEEKHVELTVDVEI